MAVLSISSDVVAGRVGNSVASPAFAALGIEAWSLPTVLYSHTPSPKGFAGGAIPFDLFDSILNRFEADGTMARLDAVHVGYVREPAFVFRIAQFLSRAKNANRDLIVSVDPVLGDDGKLYVPEATARAIKDEFVPLADILTPNLFELGWLTGLHVGTRENAAAAARSLGCPRVLITSVPAGDERSIETVLVEGMNTSVVSTPRLSAAPHGTGDALAALYLGRLLRGEDAVRAVEGAVASVYDLARAAAGGDALPVTSHARLLHSPQSVFPAARLPANRA